MIHELKYNGYSAEPSDYECADGDLATSIGLIPEVGAVKPLFPPSVALSFEKGLTVNYIHETVNFRHYILYNESGVMSWWNGSSSEYKQLYDFSSTTIYEVNSMGNTLIVLAAGGAHYFLWKDNAYLYLGTEIPELPLSFGLQGEMVRSQSFTVELADPMSNLVGALSENNKKSVTEKVLAEVNKFITDEVTNKGRFIYPFFVRYAYRLYDGSTLTKHSAPILMAAASDVVPQVFVETTAPPGQETSTFFAKVASMCHEIDYAAVTESDIDMIKVWDDIVKSVDIFISAPIYTYDQNGECKKIESIGSGINCYSVCKHTNNVVNPDHPNYEPYLFLDLYRNTFQDDAVIPDKRVLLPSKTKEQIETDIKDCSQFYFLKSIKLDEIKTERTVIDIKDDYLQSLVVREVMTDDYDSHDKLIPKFSFVYNNRLNIANIKKSLFNGFNASSLFNYSSGLRKTISVYIYIKQDGKNIRVKGDSGNFLNTMPLLYFYYPNINAYKAIIQSTIAGGATTRYEVNLEKHNFLNGAFYFAGWEGVKTTTTTQPSISVDRIIPLSNRIYTSEINNPFYFPVLGINAIGTGDIIGISSAAKALSEGQFGQFPLYAFTSEGVWALEVSSTGTYSTKQSITRDVVLGKNSITQIDSAVLFASDRGIMLLSGSKAQCISDVLNSDEIWNISKLPNAQNLIILYDRKADDNGQQKQIEEEDITFLPFRDFVKDCSMIYDYVNQRIIVYNPNVSYAYVYSFKSQKWGMMLSDITSNVNSYPEALANTKGNKLVNFSVPGTQVTTSLLITRPFTLNDANGFKTIDSIIQRGMFKSDHVQQVLYGSNDLENWHIVWSSVDRIMRGFRGTPYKAFRLALICSLEKGESIYGCSISYQQRLANKLR